jgi:hypothetical protein
MVQSPCDHLSSLSPCIDRKSRQISLTRTVPLKSSRTPTYRFSITLASYWLVKMGVVWIFKNWRRFFLFLSSQSVSEPVHPRVFGSGGRLA